MEFKNKVVIVTVSDRSREQVCSYIEGQKEKQ